jgi:hypothetical protein
LNILAARGGIEPGWGYSIRLSNLLWPSSGGVKYPKYFFGTILNSVGNDARVVGYYQFSRACDSSSASQVWMFLKLLNTGEYMHEKSFGVGRTFFRNVISFVRQVGKRSSLGGAIRVYLAAYNT